jgi:hypothetical protein
MAIPLTPAFRPVITDTPNEDKPFKRLARTRSDNTGLKAGLNDMATS